MKMKKVSLKFLIPALIAVGMSSSYVSAKVSVLYINKDNTPHTLQITCQNAQAQVEVAGQAAGSKTLPGSGPCMVRLGKSQVTVQAKEQVNIRKAKLYLQ